MLKQFDIVTNQDGDVGFIEQVLTDLSQPNPKSKFSVCWLVGTPDKHAWFDQNELSRHCNMFSEVSKIAAGSGHNRTDLEKIFQTIM